MRMDDLKIDGEFGKARKKRKRMVLQKRLKFALLWSFGLLVGSLIVLAVCFKIFG